MTNWDVKLGRQAEADLRETFEYIALTLLEPGIAEKLIQRIEAKISKLSVMPQSYAVYPKEPWKSRGLRRVNAGKYAIFFIPDKTYHDVVVIRVIYGGRDIEQILEDTEVSVDSTD